MEEKARKTGIDVIGAVSWGTHICQFYDTKQDLLDILVPFFKAGLENNESCVWITSEPLGEEEVKEAIRRVTPDFAQYLERGQIEILPYPELYLKADLFDSQRVLNFWLDKLNQALAEGYDGMRITGNVAWLEEKDWGKFTDYEEEINRVIGEYRMLAICSYPLDKCGVSEVIDVVGNHQFALIKQGDDWVKEENYECKRAEEELSESKREYDSLFQNMLNGFGYCRILVDENNQPIDFVHIEVNDAWEKLIGLKREDVIGKKITEVIPGIKESKTDLISIYGKVALTGEPTQFDLYFEPLGKWFAVSVYSPRKDYFAAVFEDKTELKRAQEMTSQATSTRQGPLTSLQKRFVLTGLEGFDDREIIELLLGLALPYRKRRKLAKECLAEFGDLNGFLAASPQELERVGVTASCMFAIKLLHELPAEVLKKKIIQRSFYQSSQEVFDYLYYSMRDLKKEIFKVLYLNNCSQIIDTADLFEGTVDNLHIHPREIMESALEHRATNLIFAHNHPAGDPAPSKTDEKITRDLVFMGMITQLTVLDHLIIGGNTYYSFADEGRIHKYEDDFLNLNMKAVFGRRRAVNSRDSGKVPALPRS